MRSVQGNEEREKMMMEDKVTNKSPECERCVHEITEYHDFPCCECVHNGGKHVMFLPKFGLNTVTASIINDSGERRVFRTRAVRDCAEGKGRMDLIPWNAVLEVSKHCERGAAKYGEHNVDLGLPLHSFVDSGFRHLAKFAAGYVDEAHLTAAAWNLLWALEFSITRPDLVDVPWKKEDKHD